MNCNDCGYPIDNCQCSLFGGRKKPTVNVGTEGHIDNQIMMNNKAEALREQVKLRIPRYKSKKYGEAPVLTDKMIDELITLIRTATMEWIPVSETLPPDDKLVHTCFPSLSGGYAHYDGWFEHGEWSYIGCLRNEAPEYWMPRAESPTDNLRGEGDE